VSLLWGMPRQVMSRSAGRPPAVWTSRRARSMTRRVRRAKAGTTSGRRSPKVCLLHSPLVQRHRVSLSRSSTPAPWAGKSCRHLTYQPCRTQEWTSHAGQRPHPSIVADTIQRPSILPTLVTSIPGPGAHSLSVPMSHQRIDTTSAQTGRRRRLIRASHRLSQTHLGASWWACVECR
jgi:hypothetical protein